MQRFFLAGSFHRNWLTGLLVALFVASSATLIGPGTVVDASDPSTRVIQLANFERARAGVRPLAANPNLARSAQNYAYLLARQNCWGHTCGPIPSFVNRNRAAGYTGRSQGENLAMGQATAEAVIATWMASPAHRWNLLNPNSTEVGVGLAYRGRYGTYWVLDLGARR